MLSPLDRVLYLVLFLLYFPQASESLGLLLDLPR